VRKPLRPGQTTLEMAIAFLVVLSLFFGIMAMWAWMDRQIARRQPPFNKTRDDAGKPSRQPGSTGSKDLKWPLDEAKPEELTEEEVDYSL